MRRKEEKQRRKEESGTKKKKGFLSKLKLKPKQPVHRGDKPPVSAKQDNDDEFVFVPAEVKESGHDAVGGAVGGASVAAAEAEGITLLVMACRL